MSVVAILGAGEIGAAAARALALRARVDAVRLIDEKETIASGKALDLLQSAPVRGSDVRIESASDASAASGADVLIVADSAAAGEWAGEPGLALLRRLERLGILDRAVVICGGATHGELMQHGFDALGLPRRRVIGSAPEALAATARALVAIEARAASQQVALALVGRPPDRFAVLWSQTSVAGHAVDALLTAPQLHQVEHRIRGLWPPGPGALGTAAALFAEAAAGGSRRLLNALVSLDRDNGTKAPVCAWPVSIGPGGLERVTAPAFTGRDRMVVDEVLA